MITTKIYEIGSMVPAFKEEQLLILFGPEATAELKDICVIHEFESKPKDSLKVGTRFNIGNQDYTITFVGNAANKNFEELGHISIYFRTGENEVLPGAIIAEPEVFPDFEVGDVITFI
jgi:PTS system glucitol/sorbitol-specific IIA component